MGDRDEDEDVEAVWDVGDLSEDEDVHSAIPLQRKSDISGRTGTGETLTLMHSNSSRTRDDSADPVSPTEATGAPSSRLDSEDFGQWEEGTLK